MKEIMLVCCAGMSTSLLVNRMSEAAKEMGEEAHIFALPVSDGMNHLGEVDCVLLGPQVRFEKSKIQKEAKKAGYNLPVEVIDMKDYGLMNGKKVYEFAKKLIAEK